MRAEMQGMATGVPGRPYGGTLAIGDRLIATF